MSETDDTAHRRQRVLVVEDDLATRRLLELLLEQTYEVALAASIGEALRQAEAIRFDLLILDINLREDQTGHDLLHELRRWPPYETVPAIAVTAYAERGDRESFLDAGFDAYLGKPFQSEALFRTVRSLLDRERENRDETLQ